jgi:hypothetical protein
MRSSCLGSTGHNSSCRGKTRRGLELKGDFGAVSGYNDFFAQNLEIRYNVRFDITYFTL